MRLPSVAIPETGLQVAAFCLGTADMGTRSDEAGSQKIFDLYRSAGGNFFDTAHCYAAWVPGGLGVPERLLGKFLRESGREGTVVATKGGHGPWEGYPRPDGYMSPERVRQDLVESLDRLGMESVEIYYLHRDDPRVPVDEVMDAMNQLADEGKIGVLGASNWAIERIVAANAYARSREQRTFRVVQNQWSLGRPGWDIGSGPTTRYHTRADLPPLAAEGVMLCPWSPTANGYYASGGKVGLGYDSARNRQLLAQVQERAARFGCTPGQIALAWLLHQGVPVVPILGTHRPSHLDDAFGALAVSPEAVDGLDPEAP